MSSNYRKVLLVAAVVCMLALFTIGVNAQATELNCNSLENDVTIDGSIGTGEWTDAYKNEMPPFFGIGADWGNSTVYIKNDEEFLYLLCDQAGTTDNAFWVIGIDANNDDHLTPNVDTVFVASYNATAEEPWAALHAIFNETYPLFDVHCTFNATEHPGMAYNGSIGTSEDISDHEHPILEMKIPLDLISVNGTEGGTVGIQYVYAGGIEPDFIYINAWPTFAWWEEGADPPTPESETIAKWGDLVIPPFGEEPPPPPPPEEGEGIPVWVYAAVAVVVIVVVVVAVFMLRRR